MKVFPNPVSFHSFFSSYFSLKTFIQRRHQVLFTSEDTGHSPTMSQQNQQEKPGFFQEAYNDISSTITNNPLMSGVALAAVFFVVSTWKPIITQEHY